METSSPRPHYRLKAEERRRQILVAATELMGTHGFRGSSLQDIAQACDFTVTGILYHFPTKEDLLEAVLDAADEAFTEDVIRELSRVGPVVEEPPGGDGAFAGEADEPEPDPVATGTVVESGEESGIWRLCRVLIRLDVANPARARLYTVLEAEAIDPSHPAHDYFLKREKRLLGHFQSTVPARVANPQALARRAMAVVSGFRLQWLKAEDAFDPNRTWEQMNIALREMLGDPLPPK